MITSREKKPTLHDHIARWGLHVAKLGRSKHHGNERAFYEQFFIDKSIDEYRYDLRHMLRREAVASTMADIQPDAVVVDIGCGVGDIINTIGSQCTRIGVEYSSHNITLAKKQFVRDILFIRGSVLALPLVSNSTDVVIFLEVMEHLANDSSALREIASLLKPKGYLIISVPSAHYFPEYLSLIGHYRHYTRQQLVCLLQEANFRVIKYIDNYPLLQVLHYYPYILLSSIHLILNRCGWSAPSLYVRPFLGKVYSLLSKYLILSKRERSQQDMACDERSTFVLAQKLA
jgi:ubiquinone/menaquinone biosynthesis C-methylase UbiE